MPFRSSPPPEGFQEAVAKWQLALRTEIKKTSSLPSSMFDACDPMLEMRLAESAEAMLKALQDPGPHLAPTGTGEQRIETVLVKELQALPARLAGGETVILDLDDGLSDEHLVVLGEVCIRGAGVAQARAAAQLQSDFDLGADTDLDALAERLWHRLTALTAGRGQTSEDPEFRTICRRIAAAVATTMLAGGDRP